MGFAKKGFVEGLHAFSPLQIIFDGGFFDFPQRQKSSNTAASCGAAAVWPHPGGFTRNGVLTARYKCGGEKSSCYFLKDFVWKILINCHGPRLRATQLVRHEPCHFEQDVTWVARSRGP